MHEDIFALLGMLLTVVFVLVLAYFCTKYFSRWKLGSFGAATSQSSHMRIMDQLTVGPDLRLLLVQVGTRHLLLGLSAAGITSLLELTPEEVALWEVLEQKSNSDSTFPTFGASFLEALKQKRK